jgi:hypothetical protein
MMWKNRLALIGAATLTGAAMATSPFAAGVASAEAPPCFGPSCVGVSPTLTSTHGDVACADDARTVTTYDLPGFGIGARVELRYSAACHANWATWDGFTDNIEYRVVTKDKKFERGVSGIAPNFTLMVDGTQLAQVCEDDGAASDGKHCSGWF